jgi:hypothetical protein
VINTPARMFLIILRRSGLCLKSPRVYVKPRFSSNEMKVGNRRVVENHSASCGAAVRARAQGVLRALGSNAPLTGAAEQRLVLCCSNISLAANKTQSPLRGSKQISIVTQGSQTRLGAYCRPLLRSSLSYYSVSWTFEGKPSLCD